MGRCKPLGSLNPFLSFAPQLSGVKSCFLVCLKEWQTWWMAASVIPPTPTSGSSTTETTTYTAYIVTTPMKLTEDKDATAYGGYLKFNSEADAKTGLSEVSRRFLNSHVEVMGEASGHRPSFYVTAESRP